jgi:fused signal recognition particle receptor
MGLFAKLVQTFTRRPAIDWEELEAMLVAGDLGAPLAMELVEQVRKSRPKDATEMIECCQELLLEMLPDDPPVPAPRPGGMPHVILVVGVNGTGKTTSTAKLGALLHDRGHRVMLAAADTFRAAAIEQLEAWATRLQLPLVKGAYKSDPAAVCHDACQAAARAKADFLLCDTAGRLHNRHNLMAELEKIRRVIGRFDASAPHDTLLVVDATTGSNALQQAREFNKATPLGGLIVTKLDGSGKGGIAVAIHRELGIPPRFIGTGEKAADFAPFRKLDFTRDLL